MSAADSAGKSADEGTEALLVEISGYRDRWRQTERLAEQRLVMLLTILAAVITATAVLLSRTVPSPSAVSYDEMLGFLWLIMSIVAAGIFVRLVKARLSIYRAIVCLNYLRCTHIALLPECTATQTLRTVLAVDSSPPPAFKCLSLPTSAAVISSCGSALAVWFLTSGSSKPLPASASAAGLTVLVVSCIYYYWRAEKFTVLLVSLATRT